MVPGQVFLKGWTDTFPVYFTLCKIVLRILRKKIFFSFPIILRKKVILSCLKMNLKLSHKLR